MPRTEQQNRALRAESQAKILSAALRLFALHGYEQTSVKMIAHAAGVAQGLLYNYFAGKDQLLVAIFEQSIADVTESFERAERTGGSEERIEHLIRSSFAILREKREFWQLSYHVRMQIGVIHGLAEQMTAWTGAIRARLEGYLRDAGASNPAIEAAILFALIDGVAQHYVLDPEQYPLDAVTDTIIRRYRSRRRELNEPQ